MKTTVITFLILTINLVFAAKTKTTTPPKDQRVCLKLSEQSFSEIDTLKKSTPEVIAFFERYMRYTITHEKGYSAVKTNCQQTIHVELYPIPQGWSVFAHYTGTSQEISLNILKHEEIQAFSERIVTALLHNKTFKTTLNRYNVMSHDSHKRLRKVKGESQAYFGLGVSPRIAYLGTEIDNRDWVLSRPFIFRVGNKYSYRNWTVAIGATAGLETNSTSMLQANKNGQVRFANEVGLNSHFLYTPDISHLVGVYYGAGSTLKIQTFRAMGEYNDQYLYGSGLDLDFILGYELFRASGREVFVQGEVNLPTYLLQSRKANGFIDSYTPATTLIMGVNF
jgi:hypothetical protein